MNPQQARAVLEELSGVLSEAGLGGLRQEARDALDAGVPADIPDDPSRELVLLIRTLRGRLQLTQDLRNDIPRAVAGDTGLDVYVLPADDPSPPDFVEGRPIGPRPRAADEGQRITPVDEDEDNRLRALYARLDELERLALEPPQ